MFLDFRHRRVVRFVLVFEGRVDLTELDPGAGLDDEFLAVVHSRRFLLWLAVDARPGLRGMQQERDARRVSGAKRKVVALFLFRARSRQVVVASRACNEIAIACSPTARTCSPTARRRLLTLA